MTALVFLCYLEPTGPCVLSGKDYLAAVNGVFFFLGQWFSIQSIKSGDLAVHSSALGMKVLLIAFCSFLVGLEESSWNLLIGVLLAVLSVFYVAGGSASGWREHRQTVWLTAVACFFFGLNDFYTGWQSREIGAARWLVIMFTVSGLISLGLLWLRRGDLGILIEKRVAGVLVCGAGLLLGLQALLVNLAFSQYGQPTLSNVVYSSRGVFAVIFLWAIGRKMDPRFRVKQIAGALLMVAALVLALGA